MLDFAIYIYKFYKCFIKKKKKEYKYKKSGHSSKYKFSGISQNLVQFLQG